MLNELRTVVTWLDYIMILCKITEICEKENIKAKALHKKKLEKLIENQRPNKNLDSEKLVINLSRRQLTKHELSALSKGLRYGLSPKKTAKFEQFYKDIEKEQMQETHLTKERFKNRLSERAYGYVKDYNYRIEKKFD